MTQPIKDQSAVVPRAKSLNTSEVQVNVGDFARRLKDLKKQTGWTNSQLADKLQVGTNSIGDWIRETAEPRIDRRRRLDARVAELMMETAEPAPEPEAEPAPPPSPDAPMVRPLTAGDRRWDV